MSPLPNGFPADRRQPNAAQARLSESGLSFVENNIAGLAGALIPGGTTFSVPPDCAGSTPVCCSDGSPDTCSIDLDLHPRAGDQPRAELTPTSPNKLGLVLRARVKTLQDIVVKVIGVQCRVSLDTSRTGSQSVRINADLAFRQDAAMVGSSTLGTTVVEMVAGSVAINDLDDGDVSLSGFNGIGDTIVCGTANLLAKGIIVGQVKTIFTSKLGDLVSSQLCKKCMGDGDCAPFAGCSNGTCQITGSSPGRCLQELGITGRMSAASALSGISPGLTGALDLYLVAGGYVQAGDAGGMSLGLLGGAVPAEGKHDPCVPAADEPVQQQIPESALLKGNTRPDGATFDLGLGVHKQFLDRAGWAAYDSGFLCLNVGTRSVELLNTDTFANILVPSLGDLLGGQVAPLVLSLRPQSPPTFDLGAGTFTSDGKIDQALLTVNLPGLEIDVFAFIDQRFSRIFTVKTDVALPIGLQLNPEGQIVPVLGDTANAFKNLVVTNSELLDETTDLIAFKFPSLLDLAVPILTSSLKPIDLPAIAGMKLKLTPGSLTGIENNTMLGVFANLSIASPKPVRQVETTAEIRAVHVPATDAFSRPGPLQQAERPRVELALGGDDRDLEWQLQIDGGPWTAWSNRREVTLSKDAFWLQGRHPILVRARVAGQPDTTDATPVELAAIIDSIAPTVVLSDQGDAILVEASDRVTASDALVVEYRFDDGAWRQAAAPPVSIAVAEGEDASLFEVRVRDQAGNFGAASGTEAGFHGRVPATGSGCSCRVGAHHDLPRGVWLVGALGMLGIVVLRTRRRAGARGGLPLVVAAAALALVAAAATGCGGSVTGDDDDDTTMVPGLKTGAIGRYLDMAAEGDRVVAVGYEDKYGDLVLSDLSSSGKLHFKPVDGVPAGAAVVDNPDGYRGGVAAEGENVGAYASVALIDGKAHAAYQHLDDGTLLYGSEGATWERHVVDAADGGGYVGLYNSLSVDASGVPGIAYLATAVPDGAGGLKSQLRWAQAASASPTATTDWSITVIAEAGIPCAGLCGDASAFACVASNNKCAMIESTCSSSCADGQACVGGSCVGIVKAPAVEDLPEGPGLFASAARLPSGDPVVAFYDRSGGDLKLATFSAGTWTITSVAVAAETDMGQWASLAVGGDGTVRIAFQDALADSLRYVEVANGSVGAIELVDDGVRADRPHPVGAAATLFFDAGGQLAVAYQDSAANDLLIGRRDAGGAWTHQELMTGAVGYGFYNAAAVSGGKTWVGTFVYDRTNFPPGEVVVQELP